MRAGPGSPEQGEHALADELTEARLHATDLRGELGRCFMGLFAETLDALRGFPPARLRAPDHIRSPGQIGPIAVPQQAPGPTHVQGIGGLLPVVSAYARGASACVCAPRLGALSSPHLAMGERPGAARSAGRGGTGAGSCAGGRPRPRTVPCPSTRRLSFPHKPTC